jgi:hypothetical protein
MADEITLRFDSELISKDEYESSVILDDVAIGKIVSIAPMVIKRAEQRIAELEQERFRLHQMFKRERDRKVLDARKLIGDDKLTNASDRVAWAGLQPTVIEAMDKEVACVSELKQVKAEHEYWRNIFISARKLETRVQQENELEIQSMRFKT